MYLCADHTVNKFTGQSTNQPVNQPNDLSTKQNTNQTIDRPTNEPINYTLNKPTNQPTRQPTNLSVVCQLANNRFWPRDYEVYKHSHVYFMATPCINNIQHF